MENENTPLIPISEVKKFMKECLMSVGCSVEAAEAQAKLLSEVDERGHLNHGMNRLESYMNDMTNGLCDPQASPKIIRETESTAWVDGNNSLGSYTGMFCMEKAIEKAKKTGVGWVTCKNANHNGVEAVYCLMAIRQGLIGMAFTNTAPLVVPTRAKNAALGTNPISIGAPGKGTDHYLLEMATSAVALGKIEMQKNKGLPLQPGWACDENGKTTLDADYAYEKPLLMPLGGTEENSSHKGTGLAILVEVLCGISAGSKYGPYIQNWITRESPPDLGQCYIAVDPNCFAPGFAHRMSDLLNFIRKMPPADPTKPIMIPGDWERINTLKVKKAGGIRYTPDLLDIYARLASKYGVQPMKDINGHPVSAGGAGGSICKATCAKKI